MDGQPTDEGRDLPPADERWTDGRWDALDALLDEALDLPREERPGFLARRCPDPDERRRVERLIAAAEDEDPASTVGGALAGRLGEAFARSLEDVVATSETIPGYELLRLIGSGGMGNVWLAEQRHPVRRRVAVKILRPDTDSHRVVARFEGERQTLALMSHPGIAQVYDAGLTDSGRPFLAMEYVDGPPVTTFCDEARLTIRARLRLFIEVCEAVQHAHRKGVIHRDLKPSNVLVTRIEGRATPKVIDFGIARLVEEARPAEAMLTEAGTMIGTPEYMSPEQAGGNPSDVDTRSDVYALGVLLYELLAGSLPFQRRDSTPGALVDLLRDVHEAEMPLPSRRIAAQGEESWPIAAARGTDVWGLTRSLRRDLDWITARALERDRDRRYGSVGELAADVRRYLRDEPAMAGPPGVTYRARKFVRRNAGLLAASAAVLVALIAGLAGTLSGLVRARHEAEHAQTQAAIAEAVNAFLNEDLLAAVAPGSQGRDVTMLEVLDTAATRLEGRFDGQPEVEAALRHTIGDTYTRLGKLDEAAPHLERAVELLAATRGDDDPATLEALHALGELRFYQGRSDEAGELIRRSFEGWERTRGPDDAHTLSALSDLGVVAQDQGRLDEAERLYRDAYDRASVALGDSATYTLSMLHNLGALLRDLARYDEAEVFLRRAYEGSRAALGDEHPETLVTLSLLGSVLREADRLDEAEPIYVEVLEVRRRVLGDEHPATLLSSNNLAMLLDDRGELEAAAELLETTLATQRRVLGDDHDATILSLCNLGGVLTRLGELDEAERLLSEARTRCDDALGHEYPLCSSALRALGNCYTAMRRFEAAEPLLLEAHTLLADAHGDDHPSTISAARSLAELYEAWGRDDDAAAWRAEVAPATTAASGGDAEH